MKILKLLGALVVLLIIALVVVGLYIDDIAKTAIEVGATEALGVSTTVGSCHIGLLRGTFKLEDLRAGGPQPYDAVKKPIRMLMLRNLVQEKIKDAFFSFPWEGSALIEEFSKSGEAKFIPITHAMEKALIRKEIDIMNHLHHCKLINLHDAYEDEDEMVLIFEL